MIYYNKNKLFVMDRWSGKFTKTIETTLWKGRLKDYSY